MTKITAIILTGLLALAVTIAQAAGKSTHAAAAGTVAGTATAIHVHSASTTLVLRVSGNHLVDLTLPAHVVMKTADGQSMAPANILLGDHLSVSRNGIIQDLSQRLITLKGIVSVAPLANGDPLVVQPPSSAAVLIDLGSRTHYSDASRETSKVEQLEDADQVQIRGLFDAVRGEVTRADSVARLGPFHKKHGKTA